MMATNPTQNKNLRLGHAVMCLWLFGEDKPKQEDQQVDDEGKEEVMREVKVFAVMDKDQYKRRASDDIQEIDQEDPPQGEFPFPGGGRGKTGEESNI